jgi:phosphohistidine phosphatase
MLHNELCLQEASVDLILWRHADAVEGTPDHIRELTSKGRKQAEKVAAFLHRHLPAEVRILVSPTTRTQETIAALTKNFTLAPTIGPAASATAVLKAAHWPNAGGIVLVVGHQPTLGAVAAQLLGSTNELLNIKKGALWWFSHRVREGSAQITLRLVISAEFL